MAEFRRPDTAFQAPRQRRGKPTKNPDHLAWIRTLPCVAPGLCNGAVEAAHIRYTDLSAGKLETGMGQKSDDMWALPLCAEHHRLGKNAQHNAGEQTWWKAIGIDPVRLAMALYRVSGNDELGAVIILATGTRNHENFT